jgi:N,N'-diacetyllegionaminate synthase
MNPIVIIAEAGVNHNGQLSLAKKLADAAAAAGADYVKFQTFEPEALVSRFAQKADYQKKATGEEEAQLAMLRKLALTKEEFVSLKTYCNEVGISFLSTPFDLGSIDFLYELGLSFWKVPSGEITNLPYLRKIAKTGMPVVLSSGMCDLTEIDAALNVLTQNGAGDVTLLHCNTEYPTPYEDVNLRAMQEMRTRFSLPVGYSDHTLGIAVPIAAAALGACVIEKHFTLDKTMEGPDHQASLSPQELADMVRAIRTVEAALGSDVKACSPSERKNRDIARKSIVAARDITQGEVFGEANLTAKRPGNGISPMRWDEVVGKRAKKSFLKDELIEL